MRHLYKYHIHTEYAKIGVPHSIYSWDSSERARRGGDDKISVMMAKDIYLVLPKGDSLISAYLTSSYHTGIFLDHRPGPSLWIVSIMQTWDTLQSIAGCDSRGRSEWGESAEARSQPLKLKYFLRSMPTCVLAADWLLEADLLCPDRWLAGDGAFGAHILHHTGSGSSWK